MKDLLSKLISLLTNLWHWAGGIQLPPGWERGPVGSVGVLVLIYAVYFGYRAESGFGMLVDILVSVVVAGLSFGVLLWVGRHLFKWLYQLPAVVWALVLLGILFGSEIWGSTTWLHWFFNLALVVCTVLLGIGSYSLVRRQWLQATFQHRIVPVTALLTGLLGLIIMGSIIFSPGQNPQPLANEVVLGLPQLKAPDPAMPGGYTFQTLTYGSGTDRRRPEFGSAADLITPPVNGASYVSFRRDTSSSMPAILKNWVFFDRFVIQLEETMRRLYWGFGVNELPLNGRIWMPGGEGPFPLVMIVHGNHSMVEDSDRGYGYLAELLASRGFMVVSIDENFLNGGVWGRSNGENDARAWLLLQHLQVWESWNEDPGSIFSGKVDMSRIALIGHSRGGEAVALASAFNELSRFPNNARILWDFGFEIRSVIAIAPVDEQWQPADHPNPLKDVNYLVLQGSHDGDVYYFDGIQQYNRVTFSGDAPEVFKAALYIYRANHGQFNTEWGDLDKSGITGQFLNRKALLSGSDQRQIAKVLISAFLEATLNGQEEYKKIFIDYRAAGNWLPQTGYIGQYSDLGSRFVADYEEDIDVTTSSIPGGKAEARGFSSWSEVALRFRNENRQDNHAVRIRWSNSNAAYTLELPPDFDWVLGQQALLVFKAADARSPDLDDEGLDFAVVLIDRDGLQAGLILSDIMPLQTQFPAEISKLAVWNEEYYKNSSEEVLQTYRVSLSEFLHQNPKLDLNKLAQIRFEFNQLGVGTVYLDEIGFDLIP